LTRWLLLTAICVLKARAQEASSGFELRTTLSGEAEYSHQLSGDGGGPVSGGFRAMLYPVWKLNGNWTVQGAVQIHSQPYFFEEFTDYDERSVKTDVPQMHVDYSRFWKRGSLVVRAGMLSSAFGSFLLRYDDSVNPLIDMPQSYGYYYKGVSNLGLAGVEADATLGRFDLRAQFTNSSPANRRGVLDSDQYGNWAGGFGYTTQQGLRIGASAYRGPYLSRDYAFFSPGEAEPKKLPATAVGVDAAWGRGPLNFYGEWQRFQMDYRAIPSYRYQTGYGELRWVLHPRWYVAERAGYLSPQHYPGRQVYESVIGFRSNAIQLIKVGYEVEQGPPARGTLANTFAVQLVTAFRAITIGRD